MFQVPLLVLSLFLMSYPEQAQAFFESRTLPAHAASATMAVLEYGYGLKSGAVATAADEMDAALLLTFGQKQVPPSLVQVLNRESRLAADLKEVYPFLRLNVTLPPDLLPADLIAHLRQALTKAGSSVHLIEEGKNLYFAVAAGNITHSLRLLPQPQPVLAQIPAAGISPAITPAAGISPAITSAAGISFVPEIPLAGTSAMSGNPAAGISAAPEIPAAGTALFIYPARPCLTIIIDDLGANLAPVRELLALPFPVSAAIIPGTAHSSYASTLLHDNGVEVLIHQPMQALYDTNTKPLLPKQKPSKSPHLLRVGMDQLQVSNLLRRSLTQVPDAVGLNNHEGSRFTKNPAAVEKFCNSLLLLQPNFFVLDSLTFPSSVLYEQALSQGFQAFKRTHFLDDALIHGKLSHAESLAAVRAELEKALQIARLRGQAIAIGHPLPATLQVLREWQGWQNEVVIRPLLP